MTEPERRRATTTTGRAGRGGSGCTVGSTARLGQPRLDDCRRRHRLGRRVHRRVDRADRLGARLGDRGPGQCDRALAVHRRPCIVRDSGRTRAESRGGQLLAARSLRRRAIDHRPGRRAPYRHQHSRHRRDRVERARHARSRPGAAEVEAAGSETVDVTLRASLGASAAAGAADRGQRRHGRLHLASPHRTQPLARPVPAPGRLRRPSPR